LAISIACLSGVYQHAIKSEASVDDFFVAGLNSTGALFF